jgi:hypothetical protein
VAGEPSRLSMEVAESVLGVEQPRAVGPTAMRRDSHSAVNIQPLLFHVMVGIASYAFTLFPPPLPLLVFPCRLGDKTNDFPGMLDISSPKHHVPQKKKKQKITTTTPPATNTQKEESLKHLQSRAFKNGRPGAPKNPSSYFTLRLLWAQTPQPKPSFRLLQRRLQGPTCPQWYSPAPGRHKAHAHPHKKKKEEEEEGNRKGSSMKVESMHACHATQGLFPLTFPSM